MSKAQEMFQKLLDLENEYNGKQDLLLNTLTDEEKSELDEIRSEFWQSKLVVQPKVVQPKPLKPINYDELSDAVKSLYKLAYKYNANYNTNLAVFESYFNNLSDDEKKQYQELFEHYKEADDIILKISEDDTDTEFIPDESEEPEYIQNEKKEMGKEIIAGFTNFVKNFDNIPIEQKSEMANNVLSMLSTDVKNLAQLELVAKEIKTKVIKHIISEMTNDEKEEIRNLLNDK